MIFNDTYTLGCVVQSLLSDLSFNSLLTHVVSPYTVSPTCLNIGNQEHKISLMIMYRHRFPALLRLGPAEYVYSFVKERRKKLVAMPQGQSLNQFARVVLFLSRVVYLLDRRGSVGAIRPSRSTYIRTSYT